MILFIYFFIKSAARHSVNVWLVNSGTQGSEEIPGCFKGRELTPSPLTLNLLPWTGHRNAPIVTFTAGTWALLWPGNFTQVGGQTHRE